MNASEQVNAALAVIEEAFKELGWNMTPVHIIREALTDRPVYAPKHRDGDAFPGAHG